MTRERVSAVVAGMMGREGVCEVDGMIWRKCVDSRLLWPSRLLHEARNLGLAQSKRSLKTPGHEKSGFCD